MEDSPGADEFDLLAPILAEYLTRVDGGEPVDRNEFLAEHPEHADALRRYFADVDFLARRSPERPPPASAPRLPSPRSFGDYELLEEIGRGGMGIVYRARERSTGRLVALKMLLHGLFVSSAEAQRFRNEAQTAASLVHPGIVPLFHAGENQGRLFYTMPLIAGSNLAQRIDGQSLEPEHAARLLGEVAAAVEYAHSRGVIHRDLKPANILIDEHERPYVSDFGLARRYGEESLSLTATGDLLGTPNYMAPEQIDGRRDGIGPATDVYALGAMLYAMLVGRPPFKSDAIPETLQKICSADPTPPTQINRSVPRQLETICLKCLEKEPPRRYQAVHELGDDLQRFLAGEPLRAQRISQLERGRRWFVRNKTLGLLAATLLLSLVAGAAFSLHYGRMATQRAHLAEANLYAADMHLAQQHIESGAVASAIALLEKHRPPGEFMDAPWEWRYLWRQCHGELRQFLGPRGAVYAAGFSPDGRYVAAAGEDRIVWLWHTGTGEVFHKLLGHAAAVRDLCFTPDGNRLATVSDDGTLRIWDVAAGQQLKEQHGHGHPPTTVSASADGKWIATAGKEDASVIIWNATTFDREQSLELGPAECIAFSPRDAQLALAGADGNVRIWRHEENGGWQFNALLRGHQDAVHAVAWSSDGERLATGGADRFVKIWDSLTWREIEPVGPLNNSVFSVRFSVDGQRLAFAERDQPARVWDVEKRQAVVELRGHTDRVSRVEFCPAGWCVLSASDDGTVRLWDAFRPTDCDELEGHIGQVRTVAFSPDGKTLASGGAQDGTIIVWDPATGEARRELTRAPNAIYDLGFSPDGENLSSATQFGQFQIWPVNTGQIVLELPLGQSNLEGVAWAPDGRHVAVISADGVVRLVDVRTREAASPWMAPPGEYGCVAYSHDGRRVLSAGGDASIRVWNVSDNSGPQELRGHEAPTVAAVFSPNDALIASSSGDHSLRLWDAASGRLIRMLTGHIGTTFGPTFSPDGHRLASSSTDQSVKIWDVEAGLELLSLGGNTDWAHDVAFSPDGQFLASAGYDGKVRVWHAGVQTKQWTAMREAVALVRHWANGGGDRDRILAAIQGDATISGAVRESAIHQLTDQLLCCTAVLAGHRAAERQDWSTASSAFERACQMAPGDVMHLYWLAMASLAGGDRTTYRRACQAMLELEPANDESSHELFWTIRAWLAVPLGLEDLARLKPMITELAARFPELNGLVIMFEIREGGLSAELDGATIPPALNSPNPEGWYFFAIQCHLGADEVQAKGAYQKALRLSQSGAMSWEATAYCETLRREVAGLLGLDPSTR